MRSACPACFVTLHDQEARYRCNSGRCGTVHDPEASRMAGFPVALRPSYGWRPSDGMPRMPEWIPCAQCGGVCNIHACPTCHRDLPPGWRQADVFTMAVAGARGAGKSVYIAVLIDALLRYAERRARTVVPFTTGTRDIYLDRYYRPLFHENRVLEGTPTLDSGGAYQRDPLIWRVVDARRGDFFVVIRDAAGEDLERATGGVPFLSYMDRADLLVFLFDSLRLPSMTQILAGLIPHVDQGRLGMTADQVLPTVLQQLQSGGTDVALTFSKFDAFHELPKADAEPYARVMGNPAARFNRDDTDNRPVGPAQAEAARSAFVEDVMFLDQEVRSLFRMIREESVTLQVDQAVQSGRARSALHFAVSAVGETPQHADRLTERGISPFRVLDPLLWGLHRKGCWI